MFGLSIKALIIIGAVTALLAAFGGTYLAGYRAGTQGEALRTERAVAAERARQQAASSATLEAARRQTEATEAENLKNQLLADGLEAELAARDAELARLIAEDASSTAPAPCRCSSNPPLSVNDAGKLDAIR